jgi:hypothetical protein
MLEKVLLKQDRRCSVVEQRAIGLAQAVPAYKTQPKAYTCWGQIADLNFTRYVGLVRTWIGEDPALLGERASIAPVQQNLQQCVMDNEPLFRIFSPMIAPASVCEVSTYQQQVLFEVHVPPPQRQKFVARQAERLGYCHHGPKWFIEREYKRSEFAQT